MFKLVFLFLLPLLLLARDPKPRLTVKSSWIGNSYSGADGKWIQHHHDAMWVRADGTFVLNSRWEEGHREGGIYSPEGEPIAMCRETGGGRGGKAAAGDDKYIYLGLAVDWSFKRRGVARYTWDGKFAGFAGAKKGNRLPLTKGFQTGMFCRAGKLYVSAPGSRQIIVVDTKTMKPVQRIAFERPASLVVDHKEVLWVIRTGDKEKPNQVFRLVGGKEVLLDGPQQPAYLALSPAGELLVADNGRRQQVLFYDISGARPTLVKAFGEAGGVWSGPTPGKVRDKAFSGLRTIGMDGKGNLYVGCDGVNGWQGTDLRKFSPAGKLLWRRLGLNFVDCNGIDPGDDTSIYSRAERFMFDYDKPAGSNWRYAAHIRNPFADQVKVKGGNTAMIRRIGGRKFMFGLDQNGANIWIHRFKGELAIPCGRFAGSPGDKTRKQPAGWRWLWYDKNADGNYQEDEYTLLGTKRDSICGAPDIKGNIWGPVWGGRIRYYPCAGLDERGIPVYRREDMQEFPRPEPFREVNRVKYIPATDTLYVAGFTADRKRQWGENKHFIPGGAVLIRYDGWLKGERKQTWRTNLPYEVKRSAKSFDVAGDLVFVVYMQTSIIEVYDARTGNHVQQVVPGRELGKVANHVWVDIPYALQAHRRKNGQYVVIVEEDVYGKNIIYQIDDTLAQ